MIMYKKDIEKAVRSLDLATLHKEAGALGVTVFEVIEESTASKKRKEICKRAVVSACNAYKRMLLGFPSEDSQHTRRMLAMSFMRREMLRFLHGARSLLMPSVERDRLVFRQALDDYEGFPSWHSGVIVSDSADFVARIMEIRNRFVLTHDIS